MNRFTCPSCESRIRLHRLLRSPIATWIRCPDCGRKLVGNYALQITDIVSTALLGAGLMVVFYFTAFLNTTFNNVIVLGAQSIAIAALATAALLLALGIVGLVIGRRWGRYEVHDESGRVPLVMRRYLAVVGVLSVGSRVNRGSVRRLQGRWRGIGHPGPKPGLAPRLTLRLPTKPESTEGHRWTA